LKARHYFTLELNEWLPPDKYAMLRACTVDGRSHFNKDRKVNTFLIALSKLAEAEQILGRRIRLVTLESAEVDAFDATQKRKKWKLDVCIDINRQIIIIILNGTPHPTPFEYVDFIWSQVKSSGVIEPRKLFRVLELHLGMGEGTFYGNRANYYAMYYWPVVALKSLNLVEQEGNGPLALTSDGISCNNWKEKLPVGMNGGASMRDNGRVDSLSDLNSFS
jgi:hypothetical protein